MKARLIRTEKLMPGVITFWFEPESRIRFDVGQFIAITIPHHNADDRGDMREFSISSTPDDELLAITSSFVETKSSTYKNALAVLKPGERVFLGEPMGDFVLPKDSSIPLVFVAAGIGVTPYKTMVEWLQKRGEKRNIQLLYGVSKPDGFLYEQLWVDFPLDYKPLVSRPNSSWHGMTGRLSVRKILELTSPVNNKLIYLAGPQKLIEPIFDGLLEARIPRSQLLLDYFPGY